MKCCRKLSSRVKGSWGEKVTVKGNGHITESKAKMLAAAMRELPELVAPLSKVLHEPLSNQQYESLGRNDIFEVRPPSLTFGVAASSSVTQRVRIVNVSQTPQRLHVLAPASSGFSMKYKKKGTLAPGCAEVIDVTYTPQDFGYHHDVIRLHTGTDNLVVPLHAYPVMISDAERAIPARLDFMCSLGDAHTRIIRLTNPVPVQFAYELAVDQDHAHISIEPMHGIVPPSGHAEITVKYAPTKAVTAAAQLTARISQFNLKPCKCTITGTPTQGKKVQCDLYIAAKLLKIFVNYYSADYCYRSAVHLHCNRSQVSRK
jgi:Flagellar-associated PapD-like